MLKLSIRRPAPDNNRSCAISYWADYNTNEFVVLVFWNCKPSLMERKIPDILCGMEFCIAEIEEGILSPELTQFALSLVRGY